MMREQRILSWCDVCANEGDPDETPTLVEATSTWTIGVTPGENRPALKLIDLCERHDKAILEPLRALLAGTGQTPELSPAAAKHAPRNIQPSSYGPVDRPAILDERICRICSEMLGTTSSLTSHVWSKHTTAKHSPVPPLRCRICGRVSQTIQGARMHLTRVHGYSAIQEAYDAVH